MRLDRYVAEPCVVDQRPCCWCGGERTPYCGVQCENSTRGKALCCKAELPPHSMHEANERVPSHAYQHFSPGELLWGLPEILPSCGWRHRLVCARLGCMGVPRCKWDQLGIVAAMLQCQAFIMSVQLAHAHDACVVCAPRLRWGGCLLATTW